MVSHTGETHPMCRPKTHWMGDKTRAGSPENPKKKNLKWQWNRRHIGWVATTTKDREDP
jgi:hypothetical protein